MQDAIKKIVFNPCAYGMEDIRGMLERGEVLPEDLERVLSRDIIGRLAESMNCLKKICLRGMSGKLVMARWMMPLRW